MAAVVKTSGPSTVLWEPFLMKKWVLVSGTTATNFPHGEGRTPDLVLTQLTAGTPTAMEVSVTSKDATNVQVQCEDGAATLEMFAFWFSQASGGTS